MPDKGRRGTGGGERGGQSASVILPQQQSVAQYLVSSKSCPMRRYDTFYLVPGMYLRIRSLI